MLVVGCGTEGTAPDTVETADTAQAADTTTPCPGEGQPGVVAGDIFPNLDVRDCDGAAVSLHDVLCGHPLVLVDIGSASHATCVEATDEYVQSEDFRALRDAGLHVMQIFTGDAGGGPATSTFCQSYSEAHAIDFPFYTDPLGASSVYATVQPFNALLDAEGRVILRWEGAIPSDRVEQIGEMLAKITSGEK